MRTVQYGYVTFKVLQSQLVKPIGAVIILQADKNKNIKFCIMAE